MLALWADTLSSVCSLPSLFAQRRLMSGRKTSVFGGGAVGIGVCVATDKSVIVAVGEIVASIVPVWVAVGVKNRVGVAVSVIVALSVIVPLSVNVAVGVSTGVSVAVSVTVSVAVAVGVAVGVRVGSGVAAGLPNATMPSITLLSIFSVTPFQLSSWPPAYCTMRCWLLQCVSPIQGIPKTLASDRY